MVATAKYARTFLMHKHTSIMRVESHTEVIIKKNGVVVPWIVNNQGKLDRMIKNGLLTQEVVETVDIEFMPQVLMDKYTRFMPLQWPLVADEKLRFFTEQLW